jgi:uncharacterized protein (PEP-CTERM system associated)
MPQLRLTPASIGCGPALGLAVALMAGPATADDTIRLTPSMTLQELYSSNILGSGDGAKPDIITQISPGLSIYEQSARSEFNFQYTPTFNHYELGNSQDRVDENLISAGKITPFTDYLEVNIEAYATETGGAANSTDVPGGTLVPTGNRVLVYLGAVEPHFTSHFGDMATVDAYYRLKSANSSDQGNTSNGPHALSTDSLNQDGQIVIGSSDSLGRVGAQLNLDHTVGSGSGANTQMNSDADFIGLQYHLNHEYSLNGTVGYQKIHYDASAGSAPFNNEGMTWTVGAQATPNQDSNVQISYGLKQGAYVPTVQVTYALGPRTSVSASYIVAIQNQLQSTIANLQYLAYDVNGRPIDSRTGLPFVAVNSGFGQQNTLFRDKPLNFSVSHQFVRSGITLSTTYEKRQSITGLFAEQSELGALIQFTRDLTPVMNCTAEAGYNDERSTGEFVNGGEHARIITLNFFLYYHLSEKGMIFASDTYLKKISNIPSASLQDNQAIIGLRKDF